MVVVAVLLLAVGAGVGVQYWRSTSGVSVAANRAPEPPVITAPGTDGQGVTVGRKGAGTHIDLYLDYRCPHCKDFEEEAGDTIGKLVDDGTATVTYHPMTFVNPKASPRIANAFACAAAAGKTRAYNDELYAGYSKAWSTQQLLELGSELRISDPAFAQCVRADGQAKWLESVGRAAAARGVNSTPTVFVDGKKLAEDQLTPDGIRAAAGARS
jgi:protein-disulfide isomerase